ncbi:hypothetical protein DPMN_148104 [Dreissena polymorpha]|uniref:Uncharacterized protein n=1 Tax=Dreissena polymorpha TaxID=45954 RepID=A0A9D4FEX2_DREPO|nr:hypothetical protein DPMN_148104 [Dreissena polymorpha]
MLPHIYKYTGRQSGNVGDCLGASGVLKDRQGDCLAPSWTVWERQRPSPTVFETVLQIR